MRKKSTSLVLALLIAFSMVLVACEPAAQPPPPPPPTPPAVEGGTDEAFDALRELRELEETFPVIYNNPNPIIPGGTFFWGRGQTGGFPGLFHPSFSGDVADSVIGSIIIYGFLSFCDGQRLITGRGDDVVGPAWIEVDVDNLELTMTFRDGVYIYWHDGVLVTMNDLLYTYELIGHPDYAEAGGVRFGTGNGTEWVVGMAEYKAGEVDYISGITVTEDGRSITIRYTQMPPSMLFGGILSYPVPRHFWENIPVLEQPGSIYARDQLLGFGPFMIENVVPGESVVLVANENYWQGRPNMDRIVYEIIHPDVATETFRAGQLDTIGFRLQDWEDYNDTNNGQFLGRIGSGIGPLLHFSLGSMYREEGGRLSIVPRDDGHPISDARVRRAIAYAVDRLTIDMTLNNGFGRPATTILTPFNAEQWIDPTEPGLSIFDLDRANAILDEAGYEMGPDGFRLDLDGNPFHVNFAMPHSTTNEIVFAMHQQNMHAIGIDFRAYAEGWTPHNVIVAYMTTHINEPDGKSNNSDMHMFQMGWSVGWNPSPAGLWGPDQNFNVSRFTAPDIEDAIARIGSMEAWDDDFLDQAYRDWSAAFLRHVPAVTASWTVGLTLINNRVANWDLYRNTGSGGTSGWHLVGLTAEHPYVHIP